MKQTSRKNEGGFKNIQYSSHNTKKAAYLKKKGK